MHEVKHLRGGACHAALFSGKSFLLFLTIFNILLLFFQVYLILSGILLHFLLVKSSSLMELQEFRLFLATPNRFNPKPSSRDQAPPHAVLLVTDHL